MLEIIALLILIFSAITLFYGIIIIHDIPYQIAMQRKHPHKEAIHYTGWVSLLTIHAIWPLLWFWATLYKDEEGWGFLKKHRQVSADPKIIESLNKISVDQSLSIENNQKSYLDIISKLNEINHKINKDCEDVSNSTKDA